MRIIPDQLRSKNLVPFKKRSGRYKIPGMTSENEVLMDRVDADLSPEEQRYVSHYLGYADALIKGAEDNASPGLNEVSAPASALSSEERLKEQPTAEPDAGIVSEAGSAKKDHPVRAA